MPANPSVEARHNGTVPQRAMVYAAPRGALRLPPPHVDPVESLRHVVNSTVQDIFFALYRDFPDEARVRGQEKF